MSENEEAERELPLRITNVELGKLFKEKMIESRAIREENRTMKREVDRLKGKMDRGVLEDLEGEDEGNEEEEPWKD